MGSLAFMPNEPKREYVPLEKNVKINVVKLNSVIK